MGLGSDAEFLGIAAERGAVDAVSGLDEAAAGPDLVVVAAPVEWPLPQVFDVLETAPDAATVTDVGSTKRPVSAAAGGDSRFVGGHPICGAETRGPERATAELFDGATWFLTPTAATEPERLRLVHGFVAGLGARRAIGPDAHDRLVAVTRATSRVLANVLLNQAGSARIDGHDPLQAAGGSLRDMTRIGGNPRIWVDIFLDRARRSRPRSPSNAASSSRSRRRSRAATRGSWRAGSARRAGPRRMLATAFVDRARSTRPDTRPDRPGVLAGDLQALGAERINVEDFELDHVSAERGGTLTMLVSGESEADKAAGCSRRRATAWSWRR